MAWKIVLLVVIVLAFVPLMYAMFKALRVNNKMFREAWAKTPPRAKRIQLWAVITWFATLGIAFGIGYAVTRNVLVAAGSAIGWAMLFGGLAPFIGFGVGKRIAHRRRSGAGEGTDPSTPVAGN